MHHAAEQRIVDRYVRAWRGAAPAITAWDEIGKEIDHRDAQGELSIVIDARLENLATRIRHHRGRGEELPSGRNRLAIRFDRSNPALPLALSIHRALLLATYDLFSRVRSGKTPKSNAVLILDILAGGLTEITAMPPQSLIKQAFPSRAAHPSFYVPYSPAIPWHALVRKSLPDALLIKLSALEDDDAVRRFGGLTATYAAEQAQSDAFALPAPPLPLQNQNETDPLTENRLFLPGSRMALPLERLTDAQRNLIGTLQETPRDKHTRAIAAKSLDISIQSANNLLARARRNGKVSERDRHLWELAELDDAIWERIQVALENATLRGQEARGPGGPRPFHNRSILAAVIILCARGFAWDDLDHFSRDLAPCSCRTAGRRIAQWQFAGDWEEALVLLAGWYAHRRPIDWSRVDPERIARSALASPANRLAPS